MGSDLRRCPVHDMTDCSPLLNGCNRLTDPSYDWTMDDTLTKDQLMKIFESLHPQPTRGPKDPDAD